MPVQDRASWLAELESHWDKFRGAGWVEECSYRAYTPATEAAAESVAASATVTGIDSIWEDDRRELRAGPDGGEYFVARRRVHLRVSHLGATRVTAKGVLVREDGTLWAVEEADYVADGNEVVCDCHQVLAGALS